MKIAVASGKGGTGKTFISTNLFNVLQKRNFPVSLVDCDAEEPNVREFLNGGTLIQVNNVLQKTPVIDELKCTFCGKCEEYCNYNAIFILSEKKMINVLEDLCHGCGACSIACKYGAISEKDKTLGWINKYTLNQNSELIEARMKVGVYSPVSVIKDAIKECANSKLAIFDSPPGTACPFIQTVEKADYVVLVTESTPFGLSDLKQSIDTLRIMKKRYGVIINRAGLGNNDIYDYLEKEKITLLMTIPFKKEIAQICSKGDLLTNISPEWDEQFNLLYHIIEDSYGNSNN